MSCSVLEQRYRSAKCALLGLCRVKKLERGSELSPEIEMLDMGEVSGHLKAVNDSYHFR